MITDVSAPFAPTARTPKPSKSGESLPSRVAVLETIWPYLLIALTVFSAIMTALVRPLWYDEVSTSVVAGLHSFPKMWAALASAADAQPPAFFFATGVSSQAFPSPEFGLRFPAIAGFTVLAVCLYFFTRRAWGRMAGVVALLVLMCSQGLYYASEARPYGALLGCVGLASLLWQNRKHGNRSVVNLIGLLAALTGVCALHYYGLFVLAVFGLVEVGLGIATRRPDWGLMLSLPVCTAPILWAKPLIDASRQQIAAGFWAHPSFKAIAEGYVFSLSNTPLNDWTLFHLRSGRPIGLGDVVPPVLLVAAAVFLFRRRHRTARPAAGTSHGLSAELALAAGLLLLPLIAGIAAMIALGGYTPRYTIAAVVGSAMLAAWIMTRLGRRPTLITALLLTLLFTGIQFRRDFHNFRHYFRGETAAAIAQGRLAPLYRMAGAGTSVVVPDGYLFFESWYYARPEQRQRLIYLQDRRMAMRFSGSDSFDVVNERLSPYMDLHLENATSFLRDHREFLMAQRGPSQSWNWARQYLDSSGAQYRPVEKGDEELIISQVLLPDAADGGSVSGK